VSSFAANPLLEALQRGAADGSVSVEQAIAALRLRLESLRSDPGRMLEHVRLVSEIGRIYPPGSARDEFCDFILEAATTLEAWGEYGAVHDSLQIIESRACRGAMQRARYVALRIGFAETGRVQGDFADADPGFWKASTGQFTRAYLMWVGGAAAAVHKRRDALLAIKSPRIAVSMPLVVAACAANVGDMRAASATLKVFEERLAHGTLGGDPALLAFFHALRGRVGMSFAENALAETDFRAAEAIVSQVPHSLPWAHVRLFRAEALLKDDLEAADRLIDSVEASNVRSNQIVRRLLKNLMVRRAVAAGQNDAFRLAIQQNSEIQDLLHFLAPSAEEVNAVSDFWRSRWDMATGAASLASQRQSSALLDHFLVASIISRFANANKLLRKVAAAHHIGRALGWTDTDLRYLRSLVLFDALPPEERAVIASPTVAGTALGHRGGELKAVVAAATLLADGIEEDRARLLTRLRAQLGSTAASERAPLTATIGMVLKQDIRRVIETQVKEMSEWKSSRPA
jgi:hypothetical protein